MNENTSHGETFARLNSEVREFVDELKESTLKLLESTPTRANKSLSRLMVLVSELDALIQKDLPATDILVQAHRFLTRATIDFMFESIELKDLRQQLEEQERKREAATHTLGEIASGIDITEIPSYLRNIAQQLHRLQERMLKSETRQNDIADNMAEHQEQCLSADVKSGLEQLHAALAEHKAESAAQHNAILQRISEIHDLRNTSTMRGRKISVSRLMKSAKRFTQHAFGRTARFPKQTSKSLHGASVSDAPATTRIGSDEILATRSGT